MITGASRGFGLALLEQFIKNRWDTLALVRKEEDALRLKKTQGDLCIPFVSDLTTDKVEADISAALKAFGDLDVLINNAGMGGNTLFLSDTSADEILLLLNVHCLGVLRVTKAAFPFMKKGGLIINISSRFGSITKVSGGSLDHVPCSYSYRIAKGAQNMLTQCMCREFQEGKPRICSVHPGKLKTDTPSPDADKTPEEAAKLLFKSLASFEHGKFYNLFEGEMDW